MLATLIPFFDKNMKVGAYSLFSQKRNYFLEPSFLGSAQNDGAGRINGLEIIQSVGIDTLTPGTDVFVPVGNIAIFSDIESECDNLQGRLTLLLDNSIGTEDIYIERLKSLKESGYKLAMRKLPIADYERYKNVLLLIDYMILDCKKVDVQKAKIYFAYQYPNVTLCVGNLDNMEMFEQFRNEPNFLYFEGSFYRLPVNQNETEVSPLKATYLELLNIVNDPDFELTKVADIIGRDTALVLSLLEMVNKMSTNSKITSIRHAVAMLGQKDLKKWINTAVTKELCSDRPSEITRLSLLRAKFMEHLAPVFGLAMKKDELFLTGLFSVLDLILNQPMEEALEQVNVSKNIFNALVNHSGDFSDAYQLMLRYENADWQEISRQMIIMGQKDDVLYDAYVEALKWYRDMFSV